MSLLPKDKTKLIERWLARLSIFGVVLLLCSPWVLTTNTLYHRLIIFMLWLPALLHLCVARRLHKENDVIGLGLYGAFSLWYAFVLIWHSGGGELGELKLPFYILLTFLGVQVAAIHLKERFSDLLLGCALIGGLAAGVTCLIAPDNGLRLITFGLWNTIIPAAQVVGSLMLLTAFLAFSKKRSPWLMMFVILALIGYLGFLALNQTRWVWISLSITTAVAAVLVNRRAGIVLLAGLALAVLLLFWWAPQAFLERGFSYRPEIWAGGVQLLAEHWVMGLGWQKFWIPVASLGISFGHPHNMLLDIGIRFGVVGLLLWSVLWLWCGYRAWLFRHFALGQASMVLWLYSGLVVLTDGTAPWEKPSPIWFVTWLPIAIILVLNKCTAHQDYKNTSV